jgi:hypothetical protein
MHVRKHLIQEEARGTIVESSVPTREVAKERKSVWTLPACGTAGSPDPWDPLERGVGRVVSSMICLSPSDCEPSRWPPRVQAADRGSGEAIQIGDLGLEE